ncbi:vesicle-associated protein 1-2-like [Bidens hawaiensis]|uniref:vesicle-associated protein 1-2-like n=1 Tax=Bidens hawaiensis TaxID=980011 RepID=UPI00404AB674
MILEIQPLELSFTFEVKKQSSCSVQMINSTNHLVAFKIKTTNPKKYCVRPNTGLILPNAACRFTVTMQAPKVAPPDMICRDKFLVQSTVVPEGTKEEDVTSNTFAKEDGKIVDEKKLRVIFVLPPDSSESSPINEPSKLVHFNESRELKDDIVIQKESHHAKVDAGVELSKGNDESVEATMKEETFKIKETEKKIEEPVKPNQEYIIKRNEESVQMNDAEELILAKDIEEMKSKVKGLELKLNEAKASIAQLTAEKRSVTQEKNIIQGELDMVKSKRHKGQVGFPLLFVLMVSFVSLYLGYLLHS